MASYNDDTIEQLEARIEELETTIRQLLPSRRDALKLGGAAVIGATALSGTASAGSSQVGTIGDASNLVDVHAEDLFDVDTINGDNLVTSGESSDYEVQKDGSDTSGVINFKTS
ncbi:MAG: hypothetical protein RI531_09310 [Haloferacaceae archaeon]|nr:hypothetical protein [Haloferacaceae archaeon]